MKKFLTFWIFLAFSTACFTQNSFQFGLLPAINLNKKLENDWKLNLKIESRQILKEGFFENENAFDYNYALTDFALVGAKKVSWNSSLAAGYLMRIKEGKRVDRLIQQFVIKRKFTGLRIAHRFSTDQTFEKEESIEIRVRYRISTEFPLSGQSVDPREFYIKINHEYLNKFQDGDYDLEIRLAPFLGFVFSDNNKLESGLDYRLSSFLDDDSKSRFWINIGWYISL